MIGPLLLVGALSLVPTSVLTQRIPSLPSFEPTLTFTAAASSRESKNVKWGVIIGGVSGAAIGTVIALNHKCQDGDGENCLWGAPMVAMGTIALGLLIGALVGESIGQAIDGEGS